MDGHNRHRRLNDSLGHHDSHSKYPSPSHMGLAGAGRGDRFHLSSNSSPQTPRGGNLGSNGNYSGYYPESTNSFSSSTSMNAYGSSEFNQDGRPPTQQSFGSYNPTGMMFNVAQPNPQSSVYDNQQFGSRQSAALSMMPPEVTSAYFGGADPNNSTTTSASPALQQSNHANSSTNSYSQPSNSLNYISSMGGVSNSVQEGPGSTEASVHEDADYSETALEEKWRSYQGQLGTVFQNILNGALESASETLLTISDWLLTQVVDLGLTVDDANLHAGRIKLWNDFNNAWLALGVAQKTMFHSGTQLSPSQSLLPRATIKKMGKTLVRLCDGLERHGLVDYHYGVWEDQISELLEECLDLYDNDSNANTSQ